MSHPNTGSSVTCTRRFFSLTSAKLDMLSFFPQWDFLPQPPIEKKKKQHGSGAFNAAGLEGDYLTHLHGLASMRSHTHTHTRCTQKDVCTKNCKAFFHAVFLNSSEVPARVSLTSLKDGDSMSTCKILKHDIFCCCISTVLHQTVKLFKYSKYSWRISTV